MTWRITNFLLATVITCVVVASFTSLTTGHIIGAMVGAGAVNLYYWYRERTRHDSR